MTIPSINEAICQPWTEQDRFLYNKLPFYLDEMQIKRLSMWETWPKLIGSVNWQANMGDTMRGVGVEPAPVQRQMAFPQPLRGVPRMDITDIRERTVDAILFRHKFESPVFNFLPSFQDFLKNHITAQNNSMNDGISRFNEMFIRGNIFNQAPFVFIPNAVGGELQNAPMSDSVTLPTETYTSNGMYTTVTGAGKTSAYLSQLFPQIGNPGNLSMNAINIALNVMETDLRQIPFEGKLTPTGDNNPLNGKFCLVTSGEAYNQFIYDPWFHDNKSFDLNIVTDRFKGSLFGRVTCKLEDLPIRISADGTFPDPETRELNPNAYNFGESVPNPAYVAAPFEVAFLVGYGDGYEAIKVGPPPSDFKGMNWNGKVNMTQDILVPCLDANGNQVWNTNKYKEGLQLFAACVFGIRGVQKRSVMPIIFKRWRGANNQFLI